MHRSLLGRIAAISLVPMTVGCSFELSCPIELFGCWESATMEFEGVESLLAGEYTLIVRTEEGTQTCTALLGDGGILLGSDDTLDSELGQGGASGLGGQSGEPLAEYYPRCTGSLGNVMSVGTDDDDRIASVGLRMSPDSLDLEVRRGDEVVLLTHVEFEYPEGKPECEEPCRQGTSTVVVPRSTDW